MSRTPCPEPLAANPRTRGGPDRQPPDHFPPGGSTVLLVIASTGYWKTDHMHGQAKV